MKNAVRVMLVAAGLGMALYPWISNQLYERSMGSQVGVYQEIVETMDDVEREEMLERARQYNEELVSSKVQLTDPFSGAGGDVSWEGILEPDGSGVAAYIEIPRINVELPVYKGTDEEILKKGVGLLEGSSLPIGGRGTHAVLTGHTGLSSAKLFTDLTEMGEGDLFLIHVLGDTLAYRVNQISVVLPEETDALMVDIEKDLVTLVTCTPYGINSHRLYVRGERTDYQKISEEEVPKHLESLWQDVYLRALILGMVAVAAIYAVKRKISQTRCHGKSKHETGDKPY